MATRGSKRVVSAQNTQPGGTKRGKRKAKGAEIEEELTEVTPVKKKTLGVKKNRPEIPLRVTPPRGAKKSSQSVARAPARKVSVKNRSKDIKKVTAPVCQKTTPRKEPQQRGRRAKHDEDAQSQQDAQHSMSDRDDDDESNNDLDTSSQQAQNGVKSAKSSGRQSPTKSISGSSVKSAPGAGRVLPTPVVKRPLPSQGGVALQPPNRGRKSASEKTPSEKSVTRSSTTIGTVLTTPKPQARPPPRLSLHAMTLALSMTRRVKQQVLKKRQEKANRVLEPTYRLEPEAKDRFPTSKIEVVIEETLEKVIRDKKYDAKSVAKQACFLSNVINGKLREFRMPRYKTVCHVVLGEVSSADVGAVSRCLWDPKTDTFASGSYSNGSIHATATVYGVYFE